jgi:dipeptidyl aminopeptidase/acylaminoacyl peptidase
MSQARGAGGKLLGVFLGIAAWIPCAAQQPTVDTGAFATWPVLGSAAISNDGKYVAYSVVRGEHGSPLRAETTTVRRVDNNWTFVSPSIGKVTFSDDNAHAVFLKTKDTLRIAKLGGATSVEDVAPVAAFRLLARGGEAWLAYQSAGADKQFVLRNLNNGVKLVIDGGATEYVVSEDGHTLAVLSGDSASIQKITWLRLPDGGKSEIWQGRRAHSLVLDSRGENLAFTVEPDSAAHTTRALWYFTPTQTQAVTLADGRSGGLDPMLRLGNASAFSKDGKRLFFDLTDRERKPRPDAVSVDVWSYTDARLQSQQLQETGPRRYLAVIKLDAPHDILRVQKEDERRESYGDIGDVVLFNRRQGDDGDYNWAITAQPKYAVVATATGARQIVRFHRAELSLGGRYVVGSDLENKNIYAYEVATGTIRNLTESLPIPMVDRDVTLEPQSQYRPLRVASWRPHDETVLIFDRFDIWEIDPLGKKPAINLTNGYGRRNQIAFRLPGYGDNRSPGCLDKACRIVSAFSEKTKDGGYYRLASEKGRDPELLTMGPYAYFGHSGELSREPPVKARDVDAYLLERETQTDSPNYFLTRDFKSFTALSDVHPERRFVWPAVQLVSFNTLDGHPLHGLLYKPGDWDVKKKYPVIMHYYEKKSDGLNQFRRPGREYGELDVTWFASHGYVVFIPDIYDTMAASGEDGINSIVGAANHLSRFPWVDREKIGLQGHSFGGFYTNYVITHSNRFAAAVASSGPAELISEYGDLWGGMVGGGVSKKEFFENRHYRMNASLWERPELYIKNSPIFDANNINTPLLMVANKKDGNVSFLQGLEFFTAMRRLGKRAWMLQYDNGTHGLDSHKDRTDYLVRMTQFFDHYLKGAPAPRWMTQGLPARLKGIETGLELDSPGKTPGRGLLLEPPRAQGTGSRPNEARMR